MLKNIKKAADLSKTNFHAAKEKLQVSLYGFSSANIGLKGQMLDEITQLVEVWPQNDLAYLLESFEGLYRGQLSIFKEGKKKNQEAIEHLVSKLSAIVAKLHERSENFIDSIHYYSYSLTFKSSAEEEMKLWEGIARTASKLLSLDTPLPLWSKYKEQLIMIRSEAYVSQSPQELMKEGFLSIIKNMIQEAVDILGPAPIPYAILESEALSNISPYPKLTFKIILDNSYTKDNVEYFNQLLKVLNLMIISVGEDNSFIDAVNLGFQMNPHRYDNFVTVSNVASHSANGIFLYGDERLYRETYKKLHPTEFRDDYHRQVHDFDRMQSALHLFYRLQYEEADLEDEELDAMSLFNGYIGFINALSKRYDIREEDNIAKINALIAKSCITSEIKKILTESVNLSIKLVYLAQKHYGNDNSQLFIKGPVTQERYVISKEDSKLLKKILSKKNIIEDFYSKFRNDAVKAIAESKDQISIARKHVELTAIMDKLIALDAEKEIAVRNAQNVAASPVTERLTAIEAIKDKIPDAKNEAAITSIMEELKAAINAMSAEMQKVQHHPDLVNVDAKIAKVNEALSSIMISLRFFIHDGNVPSVTVDGMLDFFISRPNYTSGSDSYINFLRQLLGKNLVPDSRVDEVLSYFINVANNDIEVKSRISALDGICTIFKLITPRVDEIVDLIIKSSDKDGEYGVYALRVMSHLVLDNKIPAHLWDKAWESLLFNYKERSDAEFTIKQLFFKQGQPNIHTLSEKQKLDVIDLLIQKSVVDNQIGLVQKLTSYSKEGLIPKERADVVLDIFISEKKSSDNKYRVSTNETVSTEVRYVNNINYNSGNIFLRQEQLLHEAEQIGGIEAIDKLIELGEDKDLAEQILIEVREHGAKKVLETLFTSKIEAIEPDISIARGDATLESIEKIEAIIGKEALTEIAGYYQYVSAALSNNSLSNSAAKVLQIMGNLINNLEEYLDLGNLYESIDIDNQVAIILTQLEHWVDFAASGHMYIGMPPRHPGLGPDYDPNGGAGGGGQGLIYSGDNNQDSQPVTLFIGHNTTALDL